MRRHDCDKEQNLFSNSILSGELLTLYSMRIFHPCKNMETQNLQFVLLLNCASI